MVKYFFHTGGENMKKAQVAALLGLLAALSAFGQRAVPGVRLHEKRIVDPSPRGLTLVFRLILDNPGETAVRLTRYDYQVVIGDAEYLKLQVPLPEPIRVEAGSEITIALPVKLNFAHLFPVVPDLKDKDQAVCYVAGGLIFADDRGRERRVPVAFSGDFPVYRGLDFAPVPVEAKSLSIGGAEISLGFALRNPNGFAFTLDRLAYSLELAGFPVIKGEIGEESSISARGEKTFVFPLILDFFETGAAVADGLNGAALDVRISGEAEIATPWGRWVVAFDRTAKTPVRKSSLSAGAVPAGEKERGQTTFLHHNGPARFMGEAGGTDFAS